MNLTRANSLLFVAAVALGVPTWFALQHDAGRYRSVESVPLLFAGFRAERVATIAIGKPIAGAAQPGPDGRPTVQHERLTMVRRDQRWWIAQGDLDGAPVSSARVDGDLLAQFAAIRNGPEHRIATGADDATLERYGLLASQALLISAIDAQGAVVVQLWLGKDASSLGGDQKGNVSGWYVRKDESRDVVLYEPGQWRAPTVDPGDWLDHTVHQIAGDKIRRFTVRNASSGDVELVFERPEGKSQWQATKALADVGAPRQTEIESMVQRFLFVRAQSFVKPTAKAELAQLGLLPPRLLISATVDVGGVTKDYRLLVGDKLPDRNEVHLISSELPNFVLTLASPALSPFERDLRELFDPPAPK